MEFNLPYPHTPIRTRTHHLPFGAVRTQPKYCVHTTTDGVLDCNVLYGLFDAPDVDVGVERTGDAVLGIRSPRQGVNAGGVEGPAGGDCLE